jgi:hypothetical protein
MYHHLARNVAVSKTEGPHDDHGVSKWKLALGAASLFFFLVGVKRSFRTEEGEEISKHDADRLRPTRQTVGGQRRRNQE